MPTPRKFGKATQKQIDLLKSWGITPTVGLVTCKYLIDYILEPIDPIERRKRLKTIKTFERKWVGKRVYDLEEDREGEVICLVARSRNNKKDLRESRIPCGTGLQWPGGSGQILERADQFQLDSQCR